MARHPARSYRVRRVGTRPLVPTAHLPSRTDLNPITLLKQRVVASDDLDQFGARYVSLTNLSKERGLHFLKVKAELVAAGVQPAFDPAEICATFYRRADLPW